MRRVMHMYIFMKFLHLTLFHLHHFGAQKAGNGEATSKPITVDVICFAVWCSYITGDLCCAGYSTGSVVMHTQVLSVSFEEEVYNSF